jgi:hypothetical protein
MFQADEGHFAALGILPHAMHLFLLARTKTQRAIIAAAINNYPLAPA